MNAKWRMDVFCAWGDGPDVGINMFKNGEHIFLDFTAAEAIELAVKLIQSAQGALSMEDLCRQHDTYSP